MTPEDYACRNCHRSIYVPDGMDSLEPEVRFCHSCAIEELMTTGQPERPDKTEEIERLQAGTGADGTWPKDCPQRIFVYGAAWWHWYFTGTTLYPHERDEIEAEAVRRYGEPKTEGDR